MLRAPAFALLALACGASGHWVAQSGADPNASGRCSAQAEAATDTYGCKGMACITEAIRWRSIYDSCLRGSGYAWVEDAPKPADVAAPECCNY